MSFLRIQPTHDLYQDISRESAARNFGWMPVALEILEGLDERDEYTHRDLAKICGKPKVDPELIAATNALSSWRSAIFDVHLYMLDGERRLYIDKGMNWAVLNGEPIPHPVSKEPVNDPQNECYICFRIRDGL